MKTCEKHNLLSFRKKIQLVPYIYSSKELKKILLNDRYKNFNGFGNYFLPQQYALACSCFLCVWCSWVGPGLVYRSKGNPAGRFCAMQVRYGNKVHRKERQGLNNCGVFCCLELYF